MWKNVLAIVTLLSTSRAQTTIDAKQEQLPTFECVMRGESWCILEKLDLPPGQQDFRLKAAEPLAVKDVQLQCTSLSTLSGSICSAFPNVEGFWALNCGIERLTDDALENCTKLQALSLRDNKLTHLRADTFKHNPNLEHLYISKNHLTVLPDTLFTNLKKLRRLDMDNNHLVEFDTATLLRNLASLEYFEIFSNRLSDLNATAVLQTSPRLKEIWIGDNDLQCERLADIISEFGSSRTKVKLSVKAQEKRKRKYKPVMINGTECLTAEQWLESAKRAVSIKNKFFNHESAGQPQDSGEEREEEEEVDEDAQTELQIFEFSNGDGVVLKKALFLVLIPFYTVLSIFV